MGPDLSGGTPCAFPSLTAAHALTALGSHGFVTGVETRLGRLLRPQKPGRKPAAREK